MATAGNRTHFTPSQQVISNNRDLLIDSIDIDGLYEYLKEYDMLTNDLKNELESNKPQREKNQLLCTALNDQLDSLPNLIRCLRRSAVDHPRLKDHGRLAEDLQKQLIDAEKKSQLPTTGVEGRADDVANEVEQPYNDNEPLVRRDQIPANQAVRVGRAQAGQDQAQRSSWKMVLKQVCIPAMICYMFAILLCGLCSIPTVLVTRKFWTLHSTYKMSVSYKQTVQLPMKPHVDDQFIYSLSLQLVMPGCVQTAGVCNCVCQALVLPCSKLSSFRNFTHDVTEDMYSDYFLNPDGLFYLLNGSTISVTYTGLGKSGLDEASVWIFWNQSAASNSSNVYPDCSNTKYTEYGRCKSLTKDETFVYNVTLDAAFYFIRCYKDNSTCFNHITWTMNMYTYDYNRYTNLTDSNVSIKKYDIETKKETRVTLRDNPIDVRHYGSSNTDFVKCILIHKPASFDCEQGDATSYVHVSNVTEVYDTWLFSAIVFVAVVFMIISVAVCVHVKCCFTKAGKPGIM